MKPVLSILLALIITILLFICEICLDITLNIYLGSFTLFLFILGGGIVTWFATDKKIKYSLYYGVIFAVIGFLFEGLFALILIPILAVIGGFLAKMADKDNRQIFNGYHPIIAVIAGITVTFLYSNLLALISGTYNDYLASLGLIDFIIGAVAIAIGGFTATFLAKGRKIQYGIYVGIIIVIIAIVVKLYLEMTHIINIPEDYLILTGVGVGYILAASAGSFAAKKVGEMDNKDLKMLPLMGIIGIIFIMVGVQGFASVDDVVSGSASSEGVISGSGSGGVINNSVTNMMQIVPANAPVVADLKNGSYQVSGLLKNNANMSYTKVEVIVKGYDATGAEIAENKGLINKIKANSDYHYDVILTPPKGKVVKLFNIDVLNATSN